MWMLRHSLLRFEDLLFINLRTVNVNNGFLNTLLYVLLLCCPSVIKVVGENGL